MVASHELMIDGKGGAGLGCGISDKLCTIIEAEEVPREDAADSDTSDQVGSTAGEAESQQLLERMQKARSRGPNILLHTKRCGSMQCRVRPKPTSSQPWFAATDCRLERPLRLEKPNSALPNLVWHRVPC
jgi:hypothetical protein